MAQVMAIRSYVRILFIFCAVAIWRAESLKILGVFPIAARSHYNLGRRIMLELASRGHEVTTISSYGEKDAPKTYRDVLLTGFAEQMEEERKERNMFDVENMNRLISFIFLNAVGSKITEQTFAHPNVQKLLKSSETFDIVIVEQFLNDAHKVFCFHYKAPCVILSTIGANAWVNHLVGNPSPTSYIPDLFLSHSGQMTFFQRLENTFYSIVGYLNRVMFFMPKQNAILKQYFPGAPHVDVLNNNISLILLNSHVSTNQPVPVVPNMIEIGGYHLSPPKSLLKDLQEYLDGAKDGVVYFSLGSNLKSRDLHVEKRQAIIKTLSKLKQRVLWKWEDDNLPGKPDNVKISKWFPQPEILAHPNVKVFISHGGLLSTTEAIYHGKPIIAIPIFGDQKLNAEAAKQNGFGLTVPYGQLNEKSLSSALNEMLTNKKYAENAKKRSEIMHDRPLKPIDLAVYWVEYAVRHKGAPHFRSAALDLNWYQYYLVDVFAFIGGLMYAFYCILVKFVTFLRRKKAVNVTDKKKRK